MTPQTEIFQRLVRAAMQPPLAVVPVGAPLREVLRQMTELRTAFVVVIDAERRPRGIITEHDIARRVVWKIEPGQPVETVMSAPAVAVPADAYLFQAVALLRRNRHGQAPVVDGHDAIVGMITLDDALAAMSGRIMTLIERLTHEESIEGLARVKLAQAELAQALLDDNVPAPDIQALLTEINTDIHRRVLRRVEASLVDDGWGAAPVPYSLVIMGSGGRGENFLGPDQDNGFVIADTLEGAGAGPSAYFLELARRMTTTLDAVGFPRCKGDVMATNPQWRQSVSGWIRQIDTWLRKCEPEMLLNCDIFFDFRHAYGDSALTDTVRAHVCDVLPKHAGFLRHLFVNDAHIDVALGWFGRLRKETDTEERAGMINLKLRGTMPLVQSVRLLALKAGLPATATLARLDGLKAKGVIVSSDHDALAEAFGALTRLMLRQQLEDFAEGREVGNFVPEARLTARDKRELVAALRAIDTLRSTLKMEFADSAL